MEEEQEQVERVLLHLGMVLHAIGRVPAKVMHLITWTIASHQHRDHRV